MYTKVIAVSEAADLSPSVESPRRRSHSGWLSGNDDAPAIDLVEPRGGRLDPSTIARQPLAPVEAPTDMQLATALVECVTLAGI